MRSSALVMLLAVTAHAQDAGTPLAHWDVAAKFWVAEVAEPELERCATSTGGRGDVTIAIDGSGDVGFKMSKGNEALARCVALSAAKWSGTSVTHGYIVQLRMGYPPEKTEGFVDPYPWRPRHEPFGACANFRDCGAGEVCDSSLNDGVCVDFVAYLRGRPAQKPTELTRADWSPERYDSVAYLTGELAAAIPIAAERLLRTDKKSKDCLDNIESYSVHVSREDAFITVVFSPNTSCGEGIKGGGGRVTLTSGTLKILQVKGYE